MFTQNGTIKSPAPRNEGVLNYAPGSAERAAIEATLKHMAGQAIELPLVIDGREVRTGNLEPARMPHDYRHVLGTAHLAGAKEVTAAISAAARAWPQWSRTHWTERAAVFLKAAELLANRWRPTLNAATMLGQSKTVHQAEIDSAAELIDFWRFNVDFMSRLYNEQPLSSPGVWNTTDYRPLEGFVYAATPFNFTAIAGNLPSAPALLGNTVVWKPSANAKYSAHFIMQLLEEAGLPPGVINLVYGEPNAVTNVVLEFDQTLHLIDSGSQYGLTGSIFATERCAIARAVDLLRHAAGNFYINDKPTGAVVGQQPFGGGRASGTNDKAGSMWNLLRWVSPRTIKETFDPPRRYAYPFMAGA